MRFFLIASGKPDVFADPLRDRSGTLRGRGGGRTGGHFHLDLGAGDRRAVVILRGLFEQEAQVGLHPSVKALGAVGDDLDGLVEVEQPAAN